MIAAFAIHDSLVVAIIVALILAALVYFLAGLFLPHPVPVLLALLTIVLVLLV